ncbi:MAG TPA: cytochrome c [bacterium]
MHGGSRAWALALLLPLLGLAAGCERIQVAQGARVYSQYCVSCHGAEGVGQNPARPYGSIVPEKEGWIAPALDGRGHCYQHSRQQIFEIIRDGSPFLGTPMVGFKDKLSDSDVNALVAYIISLWDENMRREYEARERLYKLFKQAPQINPSSGQPNG